MPVITYTAVDRGLLSSGHTAGTEYQIETELESYPLALEFKGQKEETLDGTPEGWSDAVQQSYPITTDLVLEANRAKWREFFSSVAAGEIFQLDLTGTIASPGTDIDVWLTDTKVQEQQLAGRNAKYAFNVKVAP